MRILCLDGGSRYGLLNAFLDAVAVGFREAGHTVVRDDVWTITETAPRDDVDLVFSFGAAGCDLTWPAPFLTWLVDNPVWSPDLVDMHPDRDGVLVVDGGHVDVMQNFLGLKMPVGFAPHGIQLLDDEPVFDDSERDIDVLICGSFDGKENVPWTTKHPGVAEATKKTIAEAQSRWTAHVRDLEVTSIFRKKAHEEGLPPVVEGYRRVAPVLGGLDARLRDRRRLACVQALDAAGVSFHLVGSGWDRVGELRNAVVSDPVEHDVLLKMARRAKVVLNAGPPLFNRGWHERIPLAMASGAFCVSETNDWLRGDSVLRPLIDTYEMADYEHLGDVVRAALADPTRTDRARAAYDLVREQHTWAHRAQMILAMVEL